MNIRHASSGLKVLAWIAVFLLGITGSFAQKERPSKIVYTGDRFYPPYSLYDDSGQPSGFNVELIQAIGRELGIEVEVHLMPWREARDALEKRKGVDVAAMFYTPERDRVVDFGVPLLTIVHEIFVRKGTPMVDSLDDLAGKRVAVEDRTFPAEYLATQHPEIQEVYGASEPECLRMLSEGKVDAAMVSQECGIYFINQAGLKNVVSAELSLLPTSYAFVTAEGRPELLHEINWGLSRVKRSGEYANLYRRWFGAHPPGISHGVPWKYVMWGTALLVVLAGASVAWIWSLRRQVAEKTRRLREELQVRENAEHRLRESEARLQAILDHSPAIVFVKDLEGRYTLVNPIFAQVTGREDATVLGHTDLEIFPPEQAQKFIDNDRTVLAGGVPMKFEEYTEHIGSGRTFVTVKFPIRDPSGEIQALGGIAMDITERKRFEREVQAARGAAERANRAKDHFLAVLSHELRTPLTPVLAAVSEALSTHLTEEQREMLEMIQRNIEFESRLIEDLLDLTRLARGKLSLNFKTVDAHELIREAAAICSPGIAGKNQELRFDLKAEHRFVHGDPARLQQVFWNVLQNAIKFSPPSSEIVLRSFNAEGGRIIVQCVDRGVGMEKEVLKQIFRPFEQVESAISRRYGGLGLGLSIARMIIEAHQGEITADSFGPGRGSVFTIDLPTVAAPKGLSVKPEPTVAAPSAERLRILLVEDSEDTRRVLAKLLTAKGHHVETADSVASAKRLWSEHEFDLLLSDIGLPDATGLELAEELRSIGPLRAIAFSGFGSREDIQRSKDAGFAEHLVKPLDINLLKQALTRVMKESPADAIHKSNGHGA